MTTRLSPEQLSAIARIEQLKRARKAIVLVHNYQPPELYEIADFIGDSLDLARRAQAAQGEVIVFCGVHFMAETAKLLNPGMKVLMPDLGARCPMADMVTADALAQRRHELADPYCICYVNTSAAVKAESDICCTSANAVRVVASAPERRPILFVPDRNLALYTVRKTKREVIPWHGFCYVHAYFSPEDVQRARREHPNARIIVHPECSPEVIDLADDVASTSGMLTLAREYPEVVLGTEAGMCNRVRRECPEKRCYPLRISALCSNMKKNSLAKVEEVLSTGANEVLIPTDIATRARLALERMLALP